MAREATESIDADPIKLLFVGDAITAEAVVGDTPDGAGKEEETEVVELDIDVILDVTREGEEGLTEVDSAATAC